MASKAESEKKKSASSRKTTTQEETSVEELVPDELIVRARTRPNRLTPLDIVSIQRLVGNAATTRLLNKVVQRENGDSEEEETSPPQEVETEDAAEEVPQHPPRPNRSPLSNAGAQRILTTAFGSIKQIVQGNIRVLSQAAFQRAYDAIYGSGQYSWARYVVPTYGNLNGFAHGGTNYINRAIAGLHTVVHEMLHNNTAADWRGVVGSRFDEGTTEVLTIESCNQANEPAPITYPNETPCVREALTTGLAMNDLKEAYLNGGAQRKIANWADTHCQENWTTIKGHMEAHRWAAARAGLRPRTAGGGGGSGAPASGGTH